MFLAHFRQQRKNTLLHQTQQNKHHHRHHQSTLLKDSLRPTVLATMRSTGRPITSASITFFYDPLSGRGRLLQKTAASISRPADGRHSWQVVQTAAAGSPTLRPRRARETSFPRGTGSLNFQGIIPQDQTSAFKGLPDERKARARGRNLIKTFSFFPFAFGWPVIGFALGPRK